MATGHRIMYHKLGTDSSEDQVGVKCQERKYSCNRLFEGVRNKRITYFEYFEALEKDEKNHEKTKHGRKLSVYTCTSKYINKFFFFECEEQGKLNQ